MEEEAGEGEEYELGTGQVKFMDKVKLFSELDYAEPLFLFMKILNSI